MTQKKESFFWTSFSDLMTSLMFIMMILFVLVMVMQYKSGQLTKAKLDKIEKIQESTKNLQGKYFSYDEEHEKYRLTINVNFRTASSDINDLGEDTHEKLRMAGDSIRSFMNKRQEQKYLMIVEGQASSDNYFHNYELSFQRALSLVKFWKDKGIYFGDNCELQIAGSGDDKLELNAWRDSIEDNNKRFLIYIIPKNIMLDSIK